MIGVLSVPPHRPQRPRDALACGRPAALLERRRTTRDALGATRTTEVRLAGEMADEPPLVL